MDYINNMIRIGTVSSVNPEKAKARVVFEDRDNLVSKELPFLFGRTLGIQVYFVPEVGEQVVCLFLPNGLEEGYIVGSYYTEKIKPPANDKKKKLIKFEDGSIVEYSDGEITISAAKNVNINAAKDINIKAATTVNIDGPAGVKISTNVTINGSLQVNGDINATGSIIDTAGNTANHSH